MTSILKVDELQGNSGSTITLGSGVTLVGADSGLASVQTFTSSGTWTRPSGITKVIMEVQGAGGGAGQAPSGNDGGGGGGGGYAKKFLDVSSISTSTITVGAAGTSSGSPTAGGNSVWSDGTNTITGSGGSAGTASSGGNGGAGGTGTNGDINIAGVGGPKGMGGSSGVQGNSFLGFSGGYTTATNNGDAATGYGGGGSKGNWNYAGTVGASSAGIVIVWEYK